MSLPADLSPGCGIVIGEVVCVAFRCGTASAVTSQDGQHVGVPKDVKAQPNQRHRYQIGAIVADRFGQWREIQQDIRQR